MSTTFPKIGPGVAECFVQTSLHFYGLHILQPQRLPIGTKATIVQECRQTAPWDDSLDRISHSLAAQSRLEHPKFLGAFTPGLAPRSHFLSLFPNLANPSWQPKRAMNTLLPCLIW